MPMAGLLADQGKFSLLLAVVAGSLGSFVGQSLLYYLGYRVGEERLKRWARRHGHWVAVSADEIDGAKLWFQRRRGSMAVFLGRLALGIRSVISVPAGLVKIPLPRFMIFTLLGTVVWTAALAVAGGLIGENYDRVERFLDPITYIVVLSMVGSYLWKVFKRYRGDGVEVGAVG